MPLRVTKKTKIKPLSLKRGKPGILLSVPYTAQEQSQWCWAACFDMLHDYYGNPATRQCQLADIAFGQRVCCTVPSSPNCDRPLGDPAITRMFGTLSLRASYTASAIAFVLLTIEIGSGRPVEAGLTWNSGGGHVVLIIDATVINNRQVVRVNDPGRGQIGIYYSELLNGYGMGVWDATWTGIERLP